MKTLVSLWARKKWGALRNIFAKPLSAILTVLGIVFMAFMIAPLVQTVGKEAADRGTVEIMSVLAMAIGVLMMISTYLTKHKALFFYADSYYLFTGPFTSRMVLGYLLLDVGVSAVLLALFCLFPLVVFALLVVLPGRVLAALLLGSCLMMWAVTALMDLLYVRQMVKGKKSKSFILVCGAVVAAFVAVGVAAAVTAPEGVGVAGALTQSPLLYYVPVFGWFHYGVVSVFAGDVAGMLIGFGLLLAAGVAAALALVNVKGEFYEQALLDAEQFSEYYEKLKSGKNDDSGRKLKKAGNRFYSGVWAIWSKNLRMGLKVNLVRPKELLMIALYVAIAVVLGYGTAGLVGMLLLWLLADATNSTLLDDLKHHYIYLIPGKPTHKLMAAMLLPVLRSCILVSLGLVVGGLIMRESLTLLALYVLVGICFCVIVSAANALSLRVLKSRSNMAAESILRMVVIGAAMLPSLGVLLLLSGLGVTSLLALGGAMGAVALGMSWIVLLLCAPMLDGRAVATD